MPQIFSVVQCMAAKNDHSCLCHITGTLNHLTTYSLGRVHLLFTCSSVGLGGGWYVLCSSPELSDHSSIISCMFRS